MNKIGVFLGDLFWSSVPYDGLDIYLHLKSVGHDVDIIMFNSDIRLNKEFDGKESFYFDTTKFQNSENLVLVKDWNDLLKVSNDYSLILTTSKVAPKTRFPKTPICRCPIAVWDIGGSDILTDAILYADYYFVKGDIWKKWLMILGVSDKKIFVTGSPHYDPYLDDCSSDGFYKKYDLGEAKKVVLVTPSNPSSHVEQFDQNLKLLEKIISLCDKNGYGVLLKTYPHDYLFYENDGQYTGVYKRMRYDIPQYKKMKDEFKEITVVQSQDHFLAVQNSDFIFNIAGSSIAWDTYFTKSISISSNFKNKRYYTTPSYLPKEVILPNGFMNYDIDSENVDDVFIKCEIDKTKGNPYFLKQNSLRNISNAILEIL